MAPAYTSFSHFPSLLLHFQFLLLSYHQFFPALYFVTANVKDDYCLSRKPQWEEMIIALFLLHPLISSKWSTCFSPADKNLSLHRIGSVFLRQHPVLFCPDDYLGEQPVPRGVEDCFQPCCGHKGERRACQHRDIPSCPFWNASPQLVTFRHWC